jgi:hypothetical protein
VKAQKLAVNIGVEVSEDIWATGEAINETKKKYSLRLILLFVNIDVSRHIFYIYIGVPHYQIF